MAEAEPRPPFGAFQARGWVVVVLILLGGVLGTVLNLWYQRSMALRSVEYWGRQATMRIADASQVELLQLEPDQTISAEEPLRTEFETSITGAPGLENVRRALLLDPDFSEQLAAATEPRWQYGLRFTEQGESTTVLVSFDPPALRSLEQPQPVSLGVLEQGMREFIEGRFIFEAQMREPPSDPDLIGPPTDAPRPNPEETPRSEETSIPEETP